MTPFEQPLQDRVGKWGERTFPTSTEESIFAHMIDECMELGEAMEEYDRGSLTTDPLVVKGKVAEEAADVYLLLLHLAHRYNIDLHEAAEEKFAVVQKRTYTTDSGRGYVRHDAESANER